MACTPAGIPAKTTELINDWIASGQYDNTQGIWTSGMDSQVVDAIKAAGKEFVPIVGADLGAFVDQLLDPTDYPGLKGAAVTNTAAVGGAGVNLALKLLNGETVQTDSSAPKPNTVLLDPGRRRERDRRGQGPAQVAGSRSRASTRTGRSASRSTAGPRTPPSRPIACKGPGE